MPSRKPHNPNTRLNLPERKWRIYEFLMDNPVGVLATVTPDNNPHAVMVYFSLDKDFNLYFLTKTGTRKYHNLQHNNHCVLLVAEPSRKITVQVTGEAQEITDSYTINRVAGAILTISSHIGKTGLPPVTKIDRGVYAAFQIIHSQVLMAIYPDRERKENESIFDSIESFELQ